MKDHTTLYWLYNIKTDRKALFLNWSEKAITSLIRINIANCCWNRYDTWTEMVYDFDGRDWHKNSLLAKDKTA